MGARACVSPSSLPWPWTGESLEASKQASSMVVSQTDKAKGQAAPSGDCSRGEALSADRGAEQSFGAWQSFEGQMLSWIWCVLPMLQTGHRGARPGCICCEETTCAQCEQCMLHDFCSGAVGECCTCLLPRLCPDHSERISAWRRGFFWWNANVSWEDVNLFYSVHSVCALS